MEPEAITDGEGCRFASKDKMPTRRNVFYALKMGGGGEREEVDSAKDSWRKVEEEDGCCGHGQCKA